MSIILQPVLKELHQRHCFRVEAKISGITKLISAKLLLSVFDLPAKAAVVNLKQFNGQYGCLCYANPAENVTPGLFVYLPSSQQHATDAEIGGESVYGVKGHSILSSAIDIVNGVPIDFMHAVLEGVTKYFNVVEFKISPMFVLSWEERNG
uniref:Uncharacterized protein n=1 Tax=Amphimedon queenslandica TaxID=400682 RepID=A0A1X7UXS7_AMPQE